VTRGRGEVVDEPIQALRLLRRGLAASPELRKGAAVTLSLALLAGGGRVITPVLVQQAIDRHLAGGRVELSGLLELAAAGVVLVLVSAWAARTTNQRLATASERALCGLRVRAFNHIHALSMAHHTEEQRGALVSRVTSDVETLGQFFRWGGLAWIINSALMLAALVAMVVYDWRLALVAVATVLPLALVLRFMQRRVVVAWDAVRTRVGESLAAISESIQGAAVIRAYGVQAQAQRRVMRSVEGRRRAEVRAGTIGALFFPSGELFGVLTTAAVLLVGMAIGPEGGLTIGTLVAFAFLVTIFLEPVAEFTEILDMTQQAVAGWKKVLDVLDTPVEVEDPKPGLTLPRGGPGGSRQGGPLVNRRALDIEVDRVSFAYHGGPPVLVDVSVAIPPGTKVAVVGSTGSGKTTLAKLLIRLADPTAGAIRVAGTDLRRVSLASLRSALVMVPQDGFLFDTSVAGNVRMGRPDPGRGHLGRRPGHRGGPAQRHRPAHPGPHRHHHRPPPGHGRARRPGPGHGAGTPGPAGHPRPAPGRHRRRLRPPPRQLAGQPFSRPAGGCVIGSKACNLAISPISGSPRHRP
jgi:putative ABC transport system ATP-binding protein